VESGHSVKSPVWAKQVGKMSQREICERYHVTHRTVRAYRIAHGLAGVPPVTPEQRTRLLELYRLTTIDGAEIRRRGMRVQLGLRPDAAIAQELRVSVYLIAKWRRWCGVPAFADRRSRGLDLDSAKPGDRPGDRPDTEIAAIHGCSYETVARARRAMGRDVAKRPKN
jgi:hypothetical protein